MQGNSAVNHVGEGLAMMANGAKKSRKQHAPITLRHTTSSGGSGRQKTLKRRLMTSLVARTHHTSGDFRPRDTADRWLCRALGGLGSLRSRRDRFRLFGSRLQCKPSLEGATCLKDSGPAAPCARLSTSAQAAGRDLNQE